MRGRGENDKKFKEWLKKKNLLKLKKLVTNKPFSLETEKIDLILK